MSVQITWKGKQFAIDFQEERDKHGEQWNRKATLGQLGARISQVTGVPVSNMKLLQCGVRMNDWNATLYDFRIGDGSRITMLGDPVHMDYSTSQLPISQEQSHSQKRELNHRQPAAMDSSQEKAHQPSASHPSESQSPMKSEEDKASIDKLHTISSRTRDTLIPQIELYADLATRFVTVHSAPNDATLSTNAALPLPTIKQLKDSHSRISELLLQQLLLLDVGGWIKGSGPSGYQGQSSATSSMSIGVGSSRTGDITNNLIKVQTELRHIKYIKPLDAYGLRKGQPEAFLPLLHYILLDFSSRLAARLAASGYELYAPKDAKFVKSVYRLLRDHFNYLPKLSKDQFLSTGFAEPRGDADLGSTSSSVLGTSSLKTTPSRLLQSAKITTGYKRTATSDSSRSTGKPRQPHCKSSSSGSSGRGNILLGNNVMLLCNKSNQPPDRPISISSANNHHNPPGNAWTFKQDPNDQTHSRTNQIMCDSYPNSYLSSAEGGTVASLDATSDHLLPYTNANKISANNHRQSTLPRPNLQSRDNGMFPLHPLQPDIINGTASIMNQPPSTFKTADAWSLHIAGRSSSPRMTGINRYANDSTMYHLQHQTQPVLPNNILPAHTYESRCHPTDSRLLDTDLDDGFLDVSIAVEPSVPPLPHSERPVYYNSTKPMPDLHDYPPLRRFIPKTADSPPKGVDQNNSNHQQNVSPKRLRVEDLRLSPTDPPHSMNPTLSIDQQQQSKRGSNQQQSYAPSLLPPRASAGRTADEEDGDGNENILRKILSKIEEANRVNNQLRVELSSMSKRMDALENTMHHSLESLSLRVNRAEKTHEQSKPPPITNTTTPQQHLNQPATSLENSTSRRASTHLTNSTTNEPLSSISRSVTESCGIPSSDHNVIVSQGQHLATMDGSLKSVEAPPESTNGTKTAAMAIKSLEEKMRLLRDSTNRYASVSASKGCIS
ncbi:hypothetical protein SeLEV6574_g00625 [Synchytrium endobioticum]|uniref:Centrosomal protein of 44 kDa n=1 Tax=Synchytrium endobioticum TaxID=286115 RepID=A0A507DGT4_9FUNG|nr:hypothetical protein SeLEV6574_g00625 [Synchytrium endobioticum]